MKVLLKNRFIPPHPKIPTCHHEYRSPLLRACSIHLIDEVLEDPIHAIQRKEISNMN
jgi:hypothetical protein